MTPRPDLPLTGKQRGRAALEGRPVDRFPVTSIYNFLYYRDHFAELTGLPAWRLHAWAHATPVEHVAVFAQLVDQVPFEMLQPAMAPARMVRERVEFVENDGRGFLRDRKTGELHPLEAETASGHATDYAANERQIVFDRKDADEAVRVTKAESMLADGVNDYLDAAVARFGKDHFILSGGVIGTLYSCQQYVGLTNLFPMLIEQPDLIEYLMQRILDQNIEHLRRLAAAGGDAIYIDDATATCDMISVAHYERFALPYITEMVKEIHRLGHLAILIYFGGIADRLEQIAATGADGLVMEASMKGYTNDIAATVNAIGQRLTLFANIDPIGVLQNADDAGLEAEVRRQIQAGRRGRGFVLSTSSPITPGTPLPRVRRFLELGRRVGKKAS